MRALVSIARARIERGTAVETPALEGVEGGCRQRGCGRSSSDYGVETRTVLFVIVGGCEATRLVGGRSEEKIRSVRASIRAALGYEVPTQ